jgi:hypothetical protein
VRRDCHGFVDMESEALGMGIAAFGRNPYESMFHLTGTADALVGDMGFEASTGTTFFTWRRKLARRNLTPCSAAPTGPTRAAASAVVRT